MDDNDTLKKLGLLVLFILFMSILCFSGKQIFETLNQYRENKKVYKEVKKDTVIVEEKKVKNKKDKEVYLRVNFDKLNARNKDCVGWVYIPDTLIDYPIVQSFDDEYYLFHTIDKVWNIAGSIFTDKSNNGLEDPHTIIYGHNMKNDTMFSSINKYKSQEFYNKHKYVYIGTEDHLTEKYQIFSCYKTVDHINPYDLDLSMEDIENMKKRSEVRCDEIAITEDFDIITLSTCTSRIKEERFVIHAVLIDTISE